MRQKALLFVLWEGGGNVPPILGLAKRMIARGHKATVISDPCNEAEVRAAGADFFSNTTAPHRYDKSADSTILRDYEAANTIEGFKMFLDHIACGPALRYAKDVLNVLNTRKIDAVVVSEALFGGCFAAEVMKLPCVMLIPGTWSFPAPGMPASSRNLFRIQRLIIFTDDNGAVQWDYTNPCNTWNNLEAMYAHNKSTLENERSGK